MLKELGFCLRRICDHERSQAAGFPLLLHCEESDSAQGVRQPGHFLDVGEHRHPGSLQGGEPFHLVWEGPVMLCMKGSRRSWTVTASSTTGSMATIEVTDS